MSDKYCADCGRKISDLRATLVPESPYCIVCADDHISEKVGFMDYSHKTAPELVIVSGSENIRRAKRVNERSR
tara:strand:+ start:572 stop:790 length:219 start_codon:yes stop_codon:yes gene_type:complete